MSVTLGEARRAQRVLRAIWVIASARHPDAVADDVARLGESLGQAIERGDLAAAEEVVAQTSAWLMTMAGVVTSRMVHAFTADD